MKNHENMTDAQLIAMHTAEPSVELQVELNNRGYSFETSTEVWIPHKYLVIRITEYEMPVDDPELYGVEEGTTTTVEENKIIAMDMTLKEAIELVGELQKTEVNKNVKYKHRFDKYSYV